MSIKNPYIGYDFVKPEIHAFNEGVKAAVQYLEEPCANHPSQDLNTYISHRKDCPLCWQELKESVK
jgi:hypothetical protein